MTSCLFCLCLAAAVGAEQAPPAAPPPKPVEPAPLVPRPAASAACPVPITVCDFCHGFKPAPGKYEVLFLHPVKCCPVWVCFDLPAGCAPPKVCCSKREIVFDYGCKAVVIKFKILCGKVAVNYY